MLHRVPLSSFLALLAAVTPALAASTATSLDLDAAASSIAKLASSAEKAMSSVLHDLDPKITIAPTIVLAPTIVSGSTTLTPGLTLTPSIALV